MRTLTFLLTMTPEDVQRGERKSCLKCPFALAIQRTLAPLQICRWEQWLDERSKQWYVEVGNGASKLTNCHGVIIGYIKNTPSMARWIGRFDFTQLDEQFRLRYTDPHPPVELTLELMGTEGLTL